MLSIRLVAADKEEPLGHDGCDLVLLLTLWGGWEGGKAVVICVSHKFLCLPHLQAPDCEGSPSALMRLAESMIAETVAAVTKTGECRHRM